MRYIFLDLDDTILDFARQSGRPSPGPWNTSAWTPRRRCWIATMS